MTDEQARSIRTTSASSLDYSVTFLRNGTP
jgi:hypothetical protein